MRGISNAARRELARLSRRDGPTRRACLLMAEIEQAEHGDTGARLEWLQRASRAARDPAWVADGAVFDRWSPTSPVSGRLDAFVWTTPVEQLGAGPAHDQPCRACRARLRQLACEAQREHRQREAPTGAEASVWMRPRSRALSAIRRRTSGRRAPSQCARRADRDHRHGAPGHHRGRQHAVPALGLGERHQAGLSCSASPLARIALASASPFSLTASASALARARTADALALAWMTVISACTFSRAAFCWIFCTSISACMRASMLAMYCWLKSMFSICTPSSTISVFPASGLLDRREGVRVQFGAVLDRAHRGVAAEHDLELLGHAWIEQPVGDRLRVRAELRVEVLDLASDRHGR